MTRALFAGTLSVLSFAISASAADVPVFNTNDASAGSLRQAILDAAPNDTVVFQIPTSNAGYNANTGVFTIGLTTGELGIDKNLTIDSRGQKIRIQRSSGSFRIFNVTTGTVTLSGLTIANGVQSSGAGVLNDGNLTLKNCTLSGHTTGMEGSHGAAISSAGPLVVTNCTITGNSVAGSALGSAIANGGNLRIDDSTITSNSGSTAVQNFNPGTARIRNSIIAGNNSGVGDVSGAFISEGYNVVGFQASGTTGFGNTGDQLGVSAAQVNLGPLQDNGGSTPTMRPKSGSVAIDKGVRGVDADSQPINVDQRGYPRPLDLTGIPNASGGDGSDVGAVETGPVQAGSAFTVTNVDSHTDGTCTTDDCTLAEAIIAANANSDANTILFAAGVGPVIGNPPSNGFVITAPVTIAGPGARQLAISGSNLTRIFFVQSAGVTFSGLTLTSGRAAGDGGIIYNSGPSTTVNDCTLSLSTAVMTTATVGNGGAIFNPSGSGLTLARCSFVSNDAQQFGGGAIFNVGTVSATNCTFAFNSAPGGGAILSISNNGTSLVTLRNCTITGNTATSTGCANCGGGGYYGEGGVGNSLHHFSNTIIAGNTNANNPDLRGYGTSEGNNLVGNLGQGGSGFSNGVNGDKVGVFPNLGSFSNHGGQTDTVALLSNSAAINMGNNNLAPAADQRGYSRVGVSDIGAFEFNGTPLVLRITRVVRVGNDLTLYFSPAASGFMYRLERANDLLQPAFWQQARTDFIATMNGEDSVTLNNAFALPPPQFFRITVP